MRINTSIRPVGNAAGFDVPVYGASGVATRAAVGGVARERSVLMHDTLRITDAFPGTPAWRPPDW